MKKIRNILLANIFLILCIIAVVFSAYGFVVFNPHLSEITEGKLTTVPFINSVENQCNFLDTVVKNQKVLSDRDVYNTISFFGKNTGEWKNIFSTEKLTDNELNNIHYGSTKYMDSYCYMSFQSYVGNNDPKKTVIFRYTEETSGQYLLKNTIGNFYGMYLENQKIKGIEKLAKEITNSNIKAQKFFENK